jgi:hypothetical protein
MSFYGLKAQIAPMSSLSTDAGDVESLFLETETPGGPELETEALVKQTAHRPMTARARNVAWMLMAGCMVVLAIIAITAIKGEREQEPRAEVPPKPVSLTGALLSTGACVDVANQKIWTSGGRTSFGDDMGRCGKPCWGGADCVGNCLVEDKGYSPACAGCFGTMAKCSRDNCAFNCMMLGKAACDSCVEKHCRPAMIECSGLTD